MKLPAKKCIYDKFPLGKCLLGLCLAVLLGIFAAGCSGATSQKEPIGAAQTQHPSTSVSTAKQNEASQGETQAGNFLDPPIERLPVKAAIAELQEEGHSGEEFCQDTHRLETASIPDYAERQPGSSVPRITQADAELYALGAAAIVQKSYDTLAGIWRNPLPRHLLCISRLITLPRLEVEWNYLNYLIRENQHIRGTKSPFRLAVPAIRSGEAVVFGCLEKEPYGNIYNVLNQLEVEASPEQKEPLVFETLLSWTGGRWRILYLRDYPGTQCSALPDFLKKAQEEIRREKASNDWIFSEWVWDEQEIQKWINS